jgi:hypothetical protein
MTADEFAEFKRNGGKTNYCEARLAWQQRLDERHETRRRRSEVFDLVVDVVAAWDSASYVAKHKKVIRNIRALPRNARRQKLSGLSTMARRHQTALRLVHALVFGGLSQADYCRRHHIEKKVHRGCLRICAKRSRDYGIQLAPLVPVP